MELAEFFKDHPKVALAFSGGVDSSYLLYAALQKWGRCPCLLRKIRFPAPV